MGARLHAKAAEGLSSSRRCGQHFLPCTLRSILRNIIKAKNYVASWPDSDETIDVAGAPLVPGYIDIHHHGGGRGAYDDGLEAAAATSHPARAIGVDDKFGTLAAGYPGDVIVLDPETLLPKGIFFV